MSGRRGTAAVVLAAGYSRRLGRPKQTVVIGGETLVDRAVRVAQEAGLSPIVVVVNPEEDFGYALQQRGCHIIVNERASEGMAVTIQYGVNAAKLLGVGGVVLMTCDQPGVRPEHLRRLVEDESRVTGSRYANKTGVPAYLPASSFEDLLRLEGDAGARELLRGAHSVEDQGLGVDVDTEADLERARSILGES